jgi:transcriptional regulator with XRE-family HTH domain
MIGARIKAARKLAGLSQRALAARIGVSAMAVSKWERGAVYPGSARMMQIADACGVKPGYILRPDRQAVTLTGVHYAVIPDWA